MDGLWLWCSTWCCLIFLLADAYDMESTSPPKKMRYFYILLLGLLWLAASWFVSDGCACYLSFRLWYFGKSGLSQARRSRRHRKTSSKQKKKECHRRGQQPTTHACKLMFTNTRQQVNNERQQETKNQVKHYR